MIATTHSSRSAIAMLIVGTLSICATVARADTAAVEAPQLLVSYADLNLAKEQDARALYQRISAAARNVCPMVRARDVKQIAQGRQCVNAAIARAVRDVDSPKLAEVQASHTRRAEMG